MNNILTIVNNSEHECSNICSRVCFQFLLGIFSNMGFLGPLTILCIIFLGGGLPYCFLQWLQLFLSFEARHYKKLVCECVLSCSVVSDSFLLIFLSGHGRVACVFTSSDGFSIFYSVYEIVCPVELCLSIGRWLCVLTFICLCS